MLKTMTFHWKNCVGKQIERWKWRRIIFHSHFSAMQSKPSAQQPDVDMNDVFARRCLLNAREYFLYWMMQTANIGYTVFALCVVEWWMLIRRHHPECTALPCNFRTQTPASIAWISIWKRFMNLFALTASIDRFQCRSGTSNGKSNCGME